MPNAGYGPHDIAEQLIAHFDGYSINAAGDTPDSGYMVALAGHERVLEGLDEGAVYDYVWEHWPLVQGDPWKDSWFGIWEDEDGKVTLDVSDRWTTKEVALAAARVNDQISIWDLNEGTEIWL